MKSGPSSRCTSSTTEVWRACVIQSQFCPAMMVCLWVAAGVRQNDVHSSGSIALPLPNIISLRVLSASTSSTSRLAPSAMPASSSAIAGEKSVMAGRKPRARRRTSGQDQPW
jgi:hypothetical protein